MKGESQDREEDYSQPSQAVVAGPPKKDPEHLEREIAPHRGTRIPIEEHTQDD